MNPRRQQPTTPPQQQPVITSIINQRIHVPGRVCGKAQARGHEKLLQLSDFINPKAAQADPPEEYNFWKGKAAFPLGTYGNDEIGDCTRASQAKLALQAERVEENRTVYVDPEEVKRIYFEATARLYPPGGDTGMFEIDALDCWRREDQTFSISSRQGAKDKHPHTIDAYTRINQTDIKAVKRAIWLSGAHGAKVCFALPTAWQSSNSWDIPENQQPIGPYEPYSWGGHSMTARYYNKSGLYLFSTWNLPDTFISWRAFAIYCDESYLVVDSIDKWRKKKEIAKVIDLTNLRAAVNSVSSVQIAA